jgi:hypothetical protein
MQRPHKRLLRLQNGSVAVNPRSNVTVCAEGSETQVGGATCNIQHARRSSQSHQTRGFQQDREGPLHAWHAHDGRKLIVCMQEVPAGVW